VGVREALNRNPKLACGIAAGALLATLIYLLLTREREDTAAVPAGQARAFFTTDDGKTWFTDEVRKVPPFSKDGKEAVRVYVYKCPDGKQFAAWLERYTPPSKKQLEAMQARAENAPPDLVPFGAPEVEIKPPGQSNWIKSSDPRAAAIMTPKCPAGGEPELVIP
jgi:hypothetical protein